MYAAAIERAIVDDDALSCRAAVSRLLRPFEWPASTSKVPSVGARASTRFARRRPRRRGSDAVASELDVDATTRGDGFRRARRVGPRTHIRGGGWRHTPRNTRRARVRAFSRRGVDADERDSSVRVRGDEILRDGGDGAGIERRLGGDVLIFARRRLV